MSGIFISSLLVIASLLAQFESAECLKCYQCLNVSNVTDCNNNVSCPIGTSCFTDSIGEGDSTRYNLGCRAKEICRQPNSGPQNTLVGRAVTQKSECSQCCGVDLCNRHICASGIHGLLTNQCVDDPTFDCQHVSELFNVCSDKDHAKLVCRKFCDLCDIIDGYWLSWSSWSTCSQTCGYGTLTRTRACNRTDDGLPCTGDNHERKQCFNVACPVNGGWTAWSGWSGCTVTCGVGLERRDRHCSNPYPGPKGQSCDGDARDDRICWRSSCTDGVWASWSNWGSCSASCQGGIATRRRQCNTASLTSVGHSCVGNSEEYKACNTQLCMDSVVNGGWTLWSSWSNCSAYCMSERTRNCTNPVPSTYGRNCLGNYKEKKDCNLEYCSHSVRLVNGNDPYEGRLEVFHNGQWGTVCHDGFSNTEADVVCRMLNYNGVPKAYQSAAFGSGTLPILLDDVSCSGSEENIFDCKHLPWTSNNCWHGKDVSVSCHADLDIRLVNGSSNTIGRVEVSRGDNKWGTVCSANVVKNYAENVCNMLSLSTNNAFAYAPGFFGIGPSPSFVIDTSCSKPKTDLGTCGHWARNTSSCNHNGGVGVACVETVNARLVNGTGAYNGRVEVSINGNTWGSVCTNGFESHDAKVICRMLGFPTNITIPYYASFIYGSGTHDNILSYLSCTGNEGSLAQCPVSSPISSCSRSYDAGVLCGTDMNVRLVNGSNRHNGRVEISVDGGNWGTICDTGFDKNDARVICRMLGYPINMSIPYSYGYFGRGTTSNILSYLQCSGSEQSLADCNNGLVNHCSPNNEVGVACLASSSIRARLVNGTNTHNGRVEVSIDGSNWGTVCDYSFDKPDAKVICNMLGYPSNTAIPIGDAYFGKGTEPYLLPGLACGGSERNLADCNMYGYGTCGQNHVAGVWCSDAIRARLVNGTNTHNGRVEVSIDGSNWGTVCDYSFDKPDAKVICNMLGYPSNAAIPISQAYFGKGTEPYLLPGLSCSGSERNLADCNMLGYGACGQNHVAGVLCSDTIRARLVNGTNTHNGRVEVSIDGSNWGTVCDYDFHKPDAKVICNVLGYPSNAAIPIGQAYFGKGTEPYLLPRLACGGNERNLADCYMYGYGACGQNHVAGVWCSDTIRARLVNGTNTHNGRVEVSIDGSNWGTVCDYGFDKPDAKVICNMLGYPSNNPTAYTRAHFGEGTESYILPGLGCSGNEKSLADCRMHSYYGQCGHNYVAGVSCQ